MSWLEDKKRQYLRKDLTIQQVEEISRNKPIMQWEPQKSAIREIPKHVKKLSIDQKFRNIIENSSPFA